MEKLKEFIMRYKARCGVVKNPGYQAAMATCEDIIKQIDRIFQEFKEDQNSTSTNKSNTKFPSYREAELEFMKWWHNERKVTATLTYKNMRKFYDIIVGNRA